MNQLCPGACVEVFAAPSTHLNYLLEIMGFVVGGREGEAAIASVRRAQIFRRAATFERNHRVW